MDRVDGKKDSRHYVLFHTRIVLLLIFATVRHLAYIMQVQVHYYQGDIG